MCACVYVYVCVCVCVHVNIWINVGIHRALESPKPSIHPSIHQSINPSIHPSDSAVSGSGLVAIKGDPLDPDLLQDQSIAERVRRRCTEYRRYPSGMIGAAAFGEKGVVAAFRTTIPTMFVIVASCRRFPRHRRRSSTVDARLGIYLRQDERRGPLYPACRCTSSGRIDSRGRPVLGIFGDLSQLFVVLREVWQVLDRQFGVVLVRVRRRILLADRVHARAVLPQNLGNGLRVQEPQSGIVLVFLLVPAPEAAPGERHRDPKPTICGDV